MKTLPVGRSPKLMHGCLALLLLILAVMAGCDAPAPSTRSSPTRTSMPTPTSTSRPLPVVATERVILLPVGGSLTVPAGALPQEAEVHVRLTCPPPLPTLMDDVQAVGEAFAVQATAQPSRAVTLRLPLPAGAADPGGLVMVRVEPDGNTTFLMTAVEGNELVAAAPGFGTFVLGQLLYDDRVTLAGAANLVPGELATFYPLSTLPPSLQGAIRPDRNFVVHSYLPSSVRNAKWTARGGIALLYQNTNAALVRANDEPSWGEISYEFVDQAYGRRWYGCKTIQIAPGPVEHAGQPFKVSLHAISPVTYAGEDVTIAAALYGSFEPPITWSWDFGDGESGGPVTLEENPGPFDLPLKRYAAQDLPQDYTVQVTAQDSRGHEARGSLLVRIAAQPKYRVALEGPERLAWTGQGVSANYTATVSGGQPPYYFAVVLAPGDPTAWHSSDGTLVQAFLFAEPGDYIVVARIVNDPQDQANTSALALLPVLVEGRKALGAELLNLPATARPGQQIDASIQARGGVLVVSGRKAGYTLKVDWGDGSAPLVEQNVGADRTSLEGAVLPTSHAYARPGKYTVRVEVCDATGWTAFDSREITITEAAAVAPTAAIRTSTPTSAPAVGSRPSATPTATGFAPLPTPTSSPTATEYPSVTPTVTSHPSATPSATPEPTRVLAWIRQDQVVINAANAPLEVHAPEERWKGSFTKWGMDETSFTYQERYVEHGNEWYNVSITCNLDRPPLVLMPGTRYKVTATCSHGGDGKGQEGLGVQFWYSLQGSYHNQYIDPHNQRVDAVLNYYPWSAGFDGTANKEWMVTGPPASRLGETFEMYAGWWNSPCNVTWTYRLEYH